MAIKKKVIEERTKKENEERIIKCISSKRSEKIVRVSVTQVPNSLCLVTSF